MNLKLQKAPWRTIEAADDFQGMVQFAKRGIASKIVLTKDKTVALPQPLLFQSRPGTAQNFSVDFFSRRSYWAPSVELVAVPGATLFAESNLICMDPGLVWEELEYDTAITSTGIFKTEENNFEVTDWLQSKLDDTAEIPGVTFIASCKYNTNYFHWHTEVLSQFDLFSRPSLLFDRFALPELCEFQQKTVDLSGVGKDGRITLSDPVYKFEIALISTNALSRTWIHPSVAKPLVNFRNAITRRLSVKFRGSHPVYLSRLDTPLRGMINELELCDALEAVGVTIVTPGFMSFEEQVNVFSKASLIIAPHGAALTNMIYTHADTPVLELRPIHAKGRSPLWDCSYRNLAAILGKPYGALFFESEPDSDSWICGIDTVLSAVKGLT